MDYSFGEQGEKLYDQILFDYHFDGEKPYSSKKDAQDLFDKFIKESETSYDKKIKDIELQEKKDKLKLQQEELNKLNEKKQIKELKKQIKIDDLEISFF